MSKHYRLSKQQLIDLERYEIRLTDDKIFFNDSTETFFQPYNSEDEAKAEFEKICKILIEKRNEPLFYETNGGAIVNLKEVRVINKYLDKEICFILFCGEHSNWSYDKTFDTPEAAETELKRLKELLVK